MLNKKTLLSKTQELRQVTAEIWIKGIGIVIVLGVAAFAEVAFLGIISKMFPSNFVFQFACIVGGVATGASAVTLIFAKLRWIRAGHQEFVSWAFLGLELVIMVMNLLLSFQLAQRSPPELDQWIQVYYNIVPATPIIALVGWILLFMTDRSKEIFDARRDAKEEMQDAEFDHEREQHTVLMALKKDILHIQSDQIRQEVERHIPHIQKITAEIVANEVSELIGMYVPRSNNTALLPASNPQNAIESTLAPAAPAVPPTPQPINAPIPPFASPAKKRYRHFHKRPSQAPGEHRTPPIPLEEPGQAATNAKKNKLPRMKNMKPLQPAGNATS